jgi:hypothetical protein
LVDTLKDGPALGRVAAILTVCDLERLIALIDTCLKLARDGASVRVFFRDESIPFICLPATRRRLLGDDPDAREFSAPERVSHDGLAVCLARRGELAGAGDVQLYACTSSLYLWGVTSDDLLPVLTGGRGLIAFLADDLAGASTMLTS